MMRIRLMAMVLVAPLLMAWNWAEKITPENSSRQPFPVQVTVSRTGKSLRFHVTLGLHDKTKALPEFVTLRLFAKTKELPLEQVAAATLRPTGGSEIEQVYDVDVHTELCGLLSGLEICYRIGETGALNYWIPFGAYIPKESKEPAPPRGP